MKTKKYALFRVLFPLIVIVGLCASSQAQTGIPQLDSWLTTYTGRYARIYTNDAAMTAGSTVTTWSNSTMSQLLPAYDGVQEVDYSTNWVYIRSTGFGSHIMGPWYLDAAHTQIFPNLPINTKTLFRIPRNPTVPATKTLNGGGAIGYFVDGVAMFNSWDGYIWNGTADVQAGMGGTVGYWYRDAYVNEGVTFDAANAHQPGSGMYHYHANPPALRYLLGDHVDYNATTKTYSESTNPVTAHSPILEWVADGYPVYGPYGYSNATNSAGGIRRMISGYVPRNGLNGTDNLSTNGAVRATIPAWAARMYGVSVNQSGPTVSTNYPFTRYMEDNDFLGDLTNSATGTNYQQGVNYDLDEYNGRWCVTPEFPNGTYAYFVSINSNGIPTFPYNIGHQFYGNPTGSTVSNITETVTTNFLGGPNALPALNKPNVNSGVVTLTWSATEGGTYLVESSTNLNAWTTNTTSVAAVLNAASYTNASPNTQNFYTVGRTALAAYDPVTGSDTNSSGGSGGTPIITLVPTSGSQGTSFSVTATISASATPSVPPHTGAQIQSFTVGTNIVTGASYTYNGGSGSVTGTLTIQNPAATGPQTVTITFSPPQGMQQGPTYAQTGAFTIN